MKLLEQIHSKRVNAGSELTEANIELNKLIDCLAEGRDLSRPSFNARQESEDDDLDEDEEDDEAFDDDDDYDDLLDEDDEDEEDDDEDDEDDD